MTASGKFTRRLAARSPLVKRRRQLQRIKRSAKDRTSSAMYEHVMRGGLSRSHRVDSRLARQSGVERRVREALSSLRVPKL